MTRFIVVIPARLSSSRLPNKAMADIAGVPMVVRTAQRAEQSQASSVYVATDDASIYDAVSHHGFNALLTRTDHPSGTDRLAEAVEQLGLEDDAIIVNVQGDEPLIPPAMITELAGCLATQPDAALATCACPIQHADQFFDPGVVKVVCTREHHALYFSRAPIPWARDALADGQQRLAHKLPALHHIGIYAYRAAFLKQFPGLNKGPLEHFESLEQLRALENNYSIFVQVVPSLPAPGVDTAADLERVRRAWSEQTF